MRDFLRITLPLAAVNFLNQASRAMLALIGPLIALEFGLSAADLGLLAAVLFAAYALAQLPVGVALDRHGARRVQTALSLTAAIGFATCALAQDPLTLALGRAVTGIGIAAGLMAMLKANAQWFPRERVAAMTGSGVFVGGLGGMAATLPLQSILPLAGWRGGFAILALMAAAIALWIWRSLDDAPPGHAPPPRRPLAQEAAAYGPIFAHPAFRRWVPAVAVLSAMNFTYQGLWAGPWLRDVAGLDDATRAAVLFLYMGGMAAGAIGNGQLASLLQARGMPALLLPMLGVGVQLAVQAWLILAPPGALWALGLAWFLFAYAGGAGPIGYAAVGQRFAPEFAGRVATAINASMLVLVFVLQVTIGAILDLWPLTASGGWDARGYAWAMGLTLLLQALSLAWAWRDPRGLAAFRG